MIKLIYKTHRILSYFLFLQVALWVIGGVVFSVVPFDSIIKGGAVLREPVQDFTNIQPEEVNGVLLEIFQDMEGLNSISTHATSQGLALKLQYNDVAQWLGLADGKSLSKPAAKEIQNYAQTLYKGKGDVKGVYLLEESEYRFLGLVDELYGKTNVWQVCFDDAYNTRMYFTADTGQYLTLRNDYWVVYDALWRLHIMDYSDGENFNNALLRVFAISALLFIISGVALSVHRIKQVFRKRRSV